MKTYKRIGWFAGVISALLFSIIQAAPLQDEFAQLNTQREKRETLIDYLKASNETREGVDGLLKIEDSMPLAAKAVLHAENKDRQRMFAIIATLENISASQVAKQFAQRMGVDTSAPEFVTTLRLHGSNTVGASLAPEIVKAFLAKLGHSEISVEKEGVESKIRYKQLGKREIGVVEIKAHGSSTAFGETSSSKNVGLFRGFADIGMASRQIKEKEQVKLADVGKGDLRSAASEFPIALDGVAVIVNRSNPIQELTVQQVAELFSGKIKNWKQLGGADQPVSIFARDDQSGTWDTFKSRVLKPSKVSLSDTNVKRYEDSGLLVRNVASERGGIGFCGLAYVDSSVSGVGVKASANTRGFQPTRLTVKTQDYPLARLLYFYLPIDANNMARDLVKFAMSNEGQAVVDQVGLVGQGLSTKQDASNAAKLKKQLLMDSSAPQRYKDLIADADRRDTQANIRFMFGSNNPDVNSINNLDRIASYLANAGSENYTVILAGFADSVGKKSSNLSLSERRANVIKDLLQAKGVQNVIATGFGEAMPVADNDSDAGRSKNRRVEVWLKRD